MSAYTPDRPPTNELQAYRSGRPVSHRHGRTWQDALHFLLGFGLPTVVTTSIAAQPSASPGDVFFAYKRSPGARALLVAIELHEPAASGADCTVEVSRVSGTTDYLPVAGATEGDLRGAYDLVPQVGEWADLRQWVDVIDVSALTVGALAWLRVRWTNGAGTTRGVSKLTVLEVPRRTLVTDSSDAGIDGGWPFTGNYLWDGTASTLDGFVRLGAELDRARTEGRGYVQLATVEAVADAWSCGISVGVWAAVTFGASSQPSLWTRAKRLYETTTNNAKSFVCRYTTQHATAGAQLRITATSLTTGTVVTTTVTLPASLGWTTLTETAAAIPCDGDDQEVELAFDFQTTVGADLLLSQIALYDEEV